MKERLILILMGVFCWGLVLIIDTSQESAEKYTRGLIQPPYAITVQSPVTFRKGIMWTRFSRISSLVIPGCPPQKIPDISF